MIQEILLDVCGAATRNTIAMKFHRTLVEMILAVARRIGEEHVVLTGGCFQNRLLAELTISNLRNAGFMPYSHQQVPANDGGIAAGQLYATIIFPEKGR